MVQIVAPVDLDPVLLEHALEEPADIPAELPLERHLLLHHESAALPPRRERRRHLARDEAPADQDHAIRVLRLRADRIRVAVRAQVVDALELAPLDLEPAHVGPGREQRLAEPHLLASRELRDPLPRVDLHDARASQELDVVLLPPLVRGDQPVLAPLLAREVLLRQRRTEIGRVGLAPDQQDRPLGPLLPQRPRAVPAGNAAADDQEVDGPIRHSPARRPPRRPRAP